MSAYQYPYKDASFLINDVLDFDRMCQDIGLEDVNSELASAILEEAARLGSEVFAPLNEVGDKTGARLEDDGVHETPGFAEAYRQYADNGWAALTAGEEFGGQAMPRILGAATTEIWYSSCTALFLCPLLTTGAVEAIEAHGSDELKNAYLPNMISGEWSGTMCLTEPQAGSDLAATRLAQQRAAAFLVLRDFAERDLDVLALLFEQPAVFGQHVQEGGELRPGVAGRVVHLHQLLDGLQAQPQPLAAQRELEACAVALAVDAVAAVSPRRQQAQVFVEADGARGDVEFQRQLGDRVGLGRRAFGGGGRGGAGGTRFGGHG